MRNEKPFTMTPEQFRNHLMKNSRGRCKKKNTRDTTDPEGPRGNRAETIEEIITRGKKLHKEE